MNELEFDDINMFTTKTVYYYDVVCDDIRCPIIEENVDITGGITFKFLGYDGKEIKKWAKTAFAGKMPHYSLNKFNVFKIYLTDSDQIIALRLTWA